MASTRLASSIVPSVDVSAPAKIAVIGTGLIGGSIAASFRRVFPSTFISGYAQGNDATVAQQLGLIDEASASVEQCVSGANIVFVTCPVGAMPEVFTQLGQASESFELVTDCGSTKRSVIEAARMLGPAFDRFVPGHPIAGSELHGPAGASAHLFVKRNWLFCPQSKLQERAAEKLAPILESLGGQVKWVDAQAHDALFAEISHFPHWMVFAACLGIADGPFGSAALTQSGAGLKDTTRIGASSAALWADIFVDNRDQLTLSIERFEGALRSMRAQLECGDKAALAESIDRASSWRKMVT